MDLQPEALGQKRLEHGFQTFGRGAGGSCGQNVEPVEFQPARSAEHLVGVYAVRGADQVDHVGGADFIAPAAVKADSHELRLGAGTARAGVDVGDSEARAGIGGLSGRKKGGECEQTGRKGGAGHITWVLMERRSPYQALVNYALARRQGVRLDAQWKVASEARWPLSRFRTPLSIVRARRLRCERRQDGKWSVENVV